MPNMVDERFELAALIFRLAGALPYTDLKSDYQKEVAAAFAEYAKHRAVKYAKKIKMGYDGVARFAVHIEKRDGKFVLIENIDSLTDYGWKARKARKLLRRLNRFYIVAGYEAFYNAHIDLFEQSTRRFIDEAYGKVDLAWFGTYADPSNFRCVLSLSSGNYGVTVNDRIVYCLVFRHDVDIVVHEYCHNFANPLADAWYQKNAQFKRWCDDSIDPVKMPFYGNGFTMAREYVTRAYTILYGVQHGQDPGEAFIQEKDKGFKYIEQVYDMINPKPIGGQIHAH